MAGGSPLVRAWHWLVERSRSLAERRSLVGRGAGWPTTVALAVVALVGVGLRLWVWLADTELGNDEIALLYSTAFADPGDLFGALPWGQSAPPLWLLAARGSAELFGTSEMALRTLPLVLGCAQVGLFAVLARAVLGPVGALVATALAALAPFAVFYALNVKPYSSDMLVTTGLLLAALWVARHGPVDRASVAVWWAAAFAGAAMSTPGMVLVPVLTTVLFPVLLVVTLRRGPGSVLGRIGRIAGFALPSALWSYGAYLVYTHLLLPASGVTSTTAFWADGLLPEDATQEDWPGFAGEVLATFGENVIFAGEGERTTIGPYVMDTATLSVVVLVLAGLGTVLLATRDPLAALLLLCPVGTALGLAIAGVYPLRLRLALWLLPVAFVMIGAVADLRFRPRVLIPVGVAGLVATLALVCLPVTREATEEWERPLARDLSLTDPAYADDNRGLFAEVRRQWRPGDVVLTGYSQSQTGQWYGWKVGKRPVGLLAVERYDKCGPRKWLAVLPPARRYLFATGTPWIPYPVSDEDVVLEDVRRVGRVTLLGTSHHMRLWALEPTPVPAGAKPPPDLPPNRVGCVIFGRVDPPFPSDRTS